MKFFWVIIIKGIVQQTECLQNGAFSQHTTERKMNTLLHAYFLFYLFSSHPPVGISFQDTYPQLIQIQSSKVLLVRQLEHEMMLNLII